MPHSPHPGWRDAWSGADDAIPPFQAVLQALRQVPGLAGHIQGSTQGLPPGGHHGFMGRPAGPRPFQASHPQARHAQVGDAQAGHAHDGPAQRERLDQLLLATLSRVDPTFDAVRAMLARYMSAMPQGLAAVARRAVAADPALFLELYAHLRRSLEERSRDAPEDQDDAYAAEPPSGPSVDIREARARIRDAVAGRMAPPALENAGLGEDRPVPGARRAELGALKDRARQGQARDGDLLKYLELTGFGGSGR